MVTTRRSTTDPSVTSHSPSSPMSSNAKSTGTDSSSASSSSTANTVIPSPTHSPYLPTFTEKLLLGIYPITLFVGSLFSHLSPTLRPPQNESIYSPAHQSFQPASSAPSYFAQKRNVFNVYFVKIGWFWCTLAFFLFLTFVGRGRLSHSNSGSRSSTSRQDSSSSSSSSNGKASSNSEEKDKVLTRRYQALARYATSTLFWLITTQWFFGPPLIDRGFALTGGVCLRAAGNLPSDANSIKDLDKQKIANIFTHAACKAAGGKWLGGYDISGHVFLLVLGSGMLWMEILPYLLPKIKGLGVGRVIRSAITGESLRIAHELGAVELYSSSKSSRGSGRVWSAKTYASTLALGVAVLSWWMLLMTAAFFHTWFEKLTGLILAMGGIWVVYFLPRGLPQVRGVLGMPGF